MEKNLAKLKAQDIIERFGLEPLPEEGGFYRETFRDPGIIPAAQIPNHSGSRNYSTQIYYLVTPEEFSGLHAVRSTEVFHFYLGDAVEMIQIDTTGNLRRVLLGQDILNGQETQIVVPPMTWQGTRILSKEGKEQKLGWSLLGCTVAPGFDFADFIPGHYAELSKLFPQHEEWILKFTRDHF